MRKIQERLRENVNISLTLYLWCIKFLSFCVRYRVKKAVFPLNFMTGSANSRGAKRGKSRFSRATLVHVAKREASVPSSVFNFLAGSKTFRSNSARVRPTDQRIVFQSMCQCFIFLLLVCFQSTLCSNFGRMSCFASLSTIWLCLCLCLL